MRRNSRGGRSAAEHLISALRCLYSHAVADGLIAERDDPAKRVPKPRRLASTRRALNERQLAMINNIAGTTGNDPNLDTLLLRLHLETACRRGGALALHRTDLDTDQCLLQLHEKGGTVRWQPVSPTLAGCLLQHIEERGAGEANAQLLRYRTGAPITSRRYDHLWQRLGRHLPWVGAQQVSTHWLRHTTLTWVERNFGYGIARAYAGHNGRSDAGTTSTYVRADVYEVARALSALTGEDHPLLPRAANVAPVGTLADDATRPGLVNPPLSGLGGGAPSKRGELTDPGCRSR
ncbi:tyrosine-type recombinase/integrase [Micromonospora sp. PTRAS2]